MHKKRVSLTAYCDAPALLLLLLQAYLMRALRLEELQVVLASDAAAVAAAQASLSFPVDIAAAYPGAPITSFSCAPVA